MTDASKMTDGEAAAAVMSGGASPEDVASARSAENLARAKSQGGYEDPAPPSIADRKAAILADMEHAVANNGPITMAMMRELRELL